MPLPEQPELMPEVEPPSKVVVEFSKLFSQWASEAMKEAEKLRSEAISSEQARRRRRRWLGSGEQSPEAVCPPAEIDWDLFMQNYEAVAPDEFELFQITEQSVEDFYTMVVQKVMTIVDYHVGRKDSIGRNSRKKDPYLPTNQKYIQDWLDDYFDKVQHAEHEPLFEKQEVREQVEKFRRHHFPECFPKLREWKQRVFDFMKR